MALMDERQFEVIVRAWFAERDRTGIKPVLSLFAIGRKECWFSNAQIDRVVQRVRGKLYYKKSEHVSRSTLKAA